MTFTAPEVGLWAAVIHQAVEDCKGLLTAKTKPALLVAIRAYEWLTVEKNLNRKLVCEFAGVSESALVSESHKRFYEDWRPARRRLTEIIMDEKKEAARKEAKLAEKQARKSRVKSARPDVCRTHRASC